MGKGKQLSSVIYKDIKECTQGYYMKLLNQIVQEKGYKSLDDPSLTNKKRQEISNEVKALVDGAIEKALKLDEEEAKEKAAVKKDAKKVTKTASGSKSNSKKRKAVSKRAVKKQVRKNNRKITTLKRK